MKIWIPITAAILIVLAVCAVFLVRHLMRRYADRRLDAYQRELLDRLQELAKFHGAQCEESGDYPAWEYRKESNLREVMVNTYRQVFGKEPKVQAIHAGLECGPLSEKQPGLDCVTIGPEMQDIHTSRERLNIASTERTWKFLLEVLKNL